MYLSNRLARNAISCRRVKPNFAKSKWMESIRWMAIGSSMMPSGRRASAARTASVINAVSETPVRSAVCLGERVIGAMLLGQPASSLSMVRRFRVVVEGLKRLSPMVLPMVLSRVDPLGTCQ